MQAQEWRTRLHQDESLTVQERQNIGHKLALYDIKEAEHAVRDVLVLRCLCRKDPSDERAFLENATAACGHVNDKLFSQLNLSYSKLSPQFGPEIPRFASRTHVRNITMGFVRKRRKSRNVNPGAPRDEHDAGVAQESWELRECESSDWPLWQREIDIPGANGDEEEDQFVVGHDPVFNEWNRRNDNQQLRPIGSQNRDIASGSSSSGVSATARVSPSTPCWLEECQIWADAKFGSRHLLAFVAPSGLNYDE